MSRLLRNLRPILATTPRLSTTTSLIPIQTRLSSTSNPFRTGPSPPRLPAEQQAEFERLQRDASARHPEPEASETSSEKIEAEGGISGGIRRGAKPEFEGEVNPKTGEVGGPKNEPLRWGDKGDWSYNGRVTDF